MHPEEQVDIQDHTVQVKIVVADHEIADWFRRLEDGAERVDAAKRALRVGILAINTAFIGGTSELLKQSLQRWQADLHTAVLESRQKIVDAIAGCFGKEVADPVKQGIERASRDAAQRIHDRISDMERRIDPNDSTSWTGVIKKLVADIQSEFDPQRQGSYLWRVRDTLSQFYGQEGQAAVCINGAVKAAIEPVHQVANEIRKYVEEIAVRLGGTRTQAGLAFEKQSVGDLLQRAVAVTGDACEHVGADNLPGDWLITVRSPQHTSQPLGSIVIEVKDAKFTSKKEILRELQTVRERRRADAAILVFANQEQNPLKLSLSILDHEHTHMVCVWDENGLALNFAYQLGRLAIFEKNRQSAARMDVSSLRQRITELINELNEMDEIERLAELAARNAGKVKSESAKLRDKLDKRLNELLNDLPSAASGRSA
ncbi:MAG: hypothetical protein C4297_12560 [Gemmataceae bacterium]